jgi:hypothetical protein
MAGIIICGPPTVLPRSSNATSMSAITMIRLAGSCASACTGACKNPCAEPGNGEKKGGEKKGQKKRGRGQFWPAVSSSVGLSGSLRTTFMETYYHITSGTDYPAVPEDTWEMDFHRQYPCGHRPDEHARPVRLKDLGADLPLGMVTVGAGAIIRADFAELLGPSGRTSLEFGEVTDAEGKVVPSFRTLGCDYRVQLRAGPKSTRRFCTQCGRFLYYPFGTRYVLKENLCGRPIYYGEGLMFGLLIRGDLYKTVDWRRLKKLLIVRVPVLETPQDDLPADLSGVTPADLVRQRGMNV